MQVRTHPQKFEKENEPVPSPNRLADTENARAAAPAETRATSGRATAGSWRAANTRLEEAVSWRSARMADILSFGWVEGEVEEGAQCWQNFEAKLW